ncbi:HAMP domain-containing protein [Rheinheimera mesophila]|uniref:histidine kinase n=1 Tax=Rheinheimera mesophila TaxID=1547515 RepID=A0A3P3QGL0_9GAMM|nr:ATP-binding protein [Rheinheimera mesophila]RRJ20337.1 HAMP domain-containing protein [Rheinheimera mesophila]
MGQVFWKFLVAFWGALILAGTLVWAVNELSRAAEDEPRPVWIGPQLRLVLGSAQLMIDSGGIQLLGDVLQRWDDDPMSRDKILLLNARGEDYLQRKVPSNWAELLTEQAEYKVQDKSGQSWFLLAVPRHEFLLDWLRSGRGVMAASSVPAQRLDIHNAQPARPFGPAPAGARPDLASTGVSDQGPPPGMPVKPTLAMPPVWFHPAFLLAAILLTSLSVSLWLAWYFASPVRQLKRALQSLASDQWLTQLGPKVTGRRDEFGAVARSFNEMAKSVEQAISGQRRLLHDVSHEFRSPLARLQILVGLARQTPSESAMVLDKVEAETQKLNALVEEILTYSRLESGAAAVKLQPVDLLELLESVAEDGRLEALSQQKQLRVKADTTVWVQADPDLLYRALENLIRNAIKFTPALTLVTIELQQHEQQVQICISDQGPGVAHDDLAKLFTPFFRAQSKKDGVGLGLSIAKRAVESCDGELKLHNLYAASGIVCGFQAVISLPLQQKS